EAMHSLQASLSPAVLVIDEEARLRGTITDDDLRRAIRAGADMGSPVVRHMNRRFLAVPPTMGRLEALEFMHTHNVNYAPVVNAEGRVVGLHLSGELLATTRPNRAVIMAGGRGTRLAPLTDTVPKPMLRVAGRPILERVVLHLISCGIRSFFISVHYLA